MIINHASVNWENFIPKNVKTLVLGSFNPNNHMGQNANYYYGRNTNYLWKAIGDILHDNQQFFFNIGLLNNELAFQTMNDYGFCFLDLISCIQITGNNEQHEINFRAERIFNEYSDSVLFTSNTNFHSNIINVQRNYNHEIIEFIRINKPKRIIHTLGNNTIRINLTTKPKENNLGINGFQGFVNLIVENCEHFEPISKSPSGRAVRLGQNYYQNLKEWLENNLEL